MEFKVGDRIRYTNKNKYLNDAPHSPLWGGYYGKIEGTVLAANNEEYKKKFCYQYEDDDKEFPLKIKWDNGYLNGFKPSLFECFTIVNKQLKLF